MRGRIMEQIWNSFISGDVTEPVYAGQGYTGSDLKSQNFMVQNGLLFI